MKQKQEKLETKMKWMLLSTMIPMTLLIIVLLVSGSCNTGKFFIVIWKCKLHGITLLPFVFS